MSIKETITIGDKEISLTKDGYPNKRQLSKPLRKMIDEMREKDENHDLAKLKKEIIEAIKRYRGK